MPLSSYLLSYLPDGTEPELGPLSVNEVSTSINGGYYPLVELDWRLNTSLLLAAGIGSRLRPLTEATPKPGLPLLDIPLAAWGLVDLSGMGGHVFINLSAGHEVVTAALGPLLAGVEVIVESPEPLGSAGTVAALRERVTGPIVTRNADLLSSLSSAEIVRAHVANGAPATIAVQPVASGADVVDDNGRFHLVDRRAVDAAGDRFLGVSVFEPAALARLDSRGPRDLVSGLIAPLMAAGEIAIYRYDGYAIDVGTPRRYLEASLGLLYGRAPRPPVPFPGDIVEVAGGRAYLGTGAEAAPDTIGPGAIVLAGGRIEPGARIRDAIVWTNEMVPPGLHLTEGIRAFATTIGALQQ